MGVQNSLALEYAKLFGWLLYSVPIDGQLPVCLSSVEPVTSILTAQWFTVPSSMEISENEWFRKLKMRSVSCFCK